MPKMKVATFKDILASLPRVPFKAIKRQQLQSMTPISSRTRSSTPKIFHTKSTQLPIATRTRSKMLQANKSNVFSTSTLVDHINEDFKLSQTDRMANVVLDSETGNMMEHRHLIKHSDPIVHKTWAESAAD